VISGGYGIHTVTSPDPPSEISTPCGVACRMGSSHVKKQDRTVLSRKTKDGYARRSRTFRDRRKHAVMSHYSGGTPRCALCPDEVAFHALPFLCFDHIHGGGVKHRKEIGVYGAKSMAGWLKKNGFPDGFRVLCHNHNYLEAIRLRDEKSPVPDLTVPPKRRPTVDGVPLSGELRTCKVHGELPVERFHRNKAYVYKGKQVWRWVCRACDQEKTRAKRRADPEGYSAYLKEWRSKNPSYMPAHREAVRSTPEGLSRTSATAIRTRDRLRDDVLGRYGRACKCCGEGRPELLTLDHLGSGAEERQAHGLRTSSCQFRHVRDLGWPNGYQVLCWNCNVAKLDSGACPHAGVP